MLDDTNQIDMRSVNLYFLNTFFLFKMRANKTMCDDYFFSEQKATLNKTKLKMNKKKKDIRKRIRIKKREYR